MTMLYPIPCYNEACYKGTVLYSAGKEKDPYISLLREKASGKFSISWRKSAKRTSSGSALLAKIKTDVNGLKYNYNL